MKRVVVLALVFVAACSRPAAAWDPAWGELDAGTIDHTPDPAPFVIPAGLYLVTDVYAGDVITHSGDTTTYATNTVADTPGTFARVLDTVGTGGSSIFDGSSFNGRGSTTDGRGVAGTYYEDFVLTSSGFVSVNIVFFQDDTETRSHVTSPQPTARATMSPASATPGATALASPAATFATAAPRPTTTPLPVPDRPARRVVTVGISLGPAAPVLARIEVLRGRAVRLYPRVFVNGTPVAVRSWRLLDGVVSGTCAGAGSTPSCDATWTTLAPAGTLWTLRFELATATDILTASIDVVVRSPALEE